MINFKADVERPKDTAELVVLVEQLEAATAAEEVAESAYKKAKVLREELEQRTIPDKLAEFGIIGNGSKLRLVNGQTIKLEEQEYVSVSEAKRDSAIEWLRENGFGHLVKEKVIEEKVEPGHLRTLSQELQQDERALPTDIFNVFKKKKVKIQ